MNYLFIVCQFQFVLVDITHKQTQMMNIIRATRTFHPVIIGGAIFGTFNTYCFSGFRWHFNKLGEKPLPYKEFLKQNFADIALNGAVSFTVGGAVGSLGLLARQSSKRNIMAASLSTGFCVLFRTIDVML